MTVAMVGVANLCDCATAACFASSASLIPSRRIKGAYRNVIDKAQRSWSALAVISPGMCPGSHKMTHSREQTCWHHQTPVTAKHRRANLFVRKQESVPLVTLTDPSGVPHHLSSFLQQPAGTKSMLNTKALLRYEYVGNDVYRCYLPKVVLLNFEVAPIVDLFVAASDKDCRVEMRQFSRFQSCRGPKQTFFSLKNHLTWHGTPEGDQVLNLDTELEVSLEVYTVPFTMLPLSAVEVPGKAIMQAMLDRLIPLFLDYLFVDYKRWVDEEALGLGVTTVPLSHALESSSSSRADCQPLEISS
ncbi:uncharacterized protein [Physcomitrium patens]|uniref:uncharacterized protein isoform X2 n=1 Tax=Physcomitrium patens TaxID=3218 RepID=UPI000D16CDAE|nr:uncharacterized protein LOC112274547 isoform X2 [Physcomitrium patens]|eukprot:XP_024359970.1 uncharacterized protein LOC112274547 isoform X2 [Physcomitrella patens]